MHDASSCKRREPTECRPRSAKQCASDTRRSRPKSSISHGRLRSDSAADIAGCPHDGRKHPSSSLPSHTSLLGHLHGLQQDVGNRPALAAFLDRAPDLARILDGVGAAHAALWDRYGAWSTSYEINAIGRPLTVNRHAILTTINATLSDCVTV